MSAPTPQPKLPRFVVEREPWARGFLARVKSFLTERQVRVPRGAAAPVFTSGSFGAGFVDNFKEWMKGTPAAARRASHSRLEVDWKPWNVALWENLRDLIAPPKLAPLKVTSQPVKVRDIWSKNEQFQRSQALSLTVHALIAVLLIAPVIRVADTTAAAKRPEVIPIDISPYIAKLPAGDKKAGGGGGGGEHSDIAASKGKLPKFSMKPQIAPPLVAVRNLKPVLSVEPTLIGPDDLKIPSPNMANWGDPLAGLITNSSGTGSGGGIGSGSGGGIGSGTGGGLGPGEGGGTGGGVFQAGTNGVSYATCSYCPNPKYSDEGYKAKYQGSVLLRILITPDGRASNITVIRGVGLGLDESAMETVKTWRFRPSIGPNGKPVAAWNNIEVNFRIH